jgi:hypothetical protein
MNIAHRAKRFISCVVKPLGIRMYLLQSFRLRFFECKRLSVCYQRLTLLDLEEEDEEGIRREKG